MQQSQCCWTKNSPTRQKTARNKHIHPVIADLCCSSSCGRSSANILQLRSRKLRSTVTLSEVKAIPVNLSVTLLQHFVCSRPPRGLHMTERRIWAQTRGGSVSEVSQPSAPHPQSWDLSRKFLSRFQLFLPRPNFGEKQIFMLPQPHASTPSVVGFSKQTVST